MIYLIVAVYQLEASVVIIACGQIGNIARTVKNYVVGHLTGTASIDARKGTCFIKSVGCSVWINEYDSTIC